MLGKGRRPEVGEVVWHPLCLPGTLSGTISIPGVVAGGCGSMLGAAGKAAGGADAWLAMGN